MRIPEETFTFSGTGRRHIEDPRGNIHLLWDRKETYWGSQRKHSPPLGYEEDILGISEETLVSSGTGRRDTEEPRGNIHHLSDREKRK